ncbi:hypothetical protein KHA80_15190 [Anaerobacillus sp. HL2]|nr:hypothetical protein KHA80_15190 [Anaerobacillus sp. HL2]
MSSASLIKSQLEAGRKPEILLHDVLERSVFQLGAEQIDRTVLLSELYLNGRIIQLCLDELLRN